MEITKDIVYLGVNDHAVDLFESQYSVPNGMAYNSYLIMDDQTVVMDTVDAHFTDEWITKIAAALGDRAPDYLVVQHMEPDHAGSIDAFAQAYPTTKIVSSAKAFVMMQQFFGTDYADRRIVVKEGDTLPLGHHTLHFVTAPMVHWPEAMVTFDTTNGVLFSADAFGAFGALDGKLFADEVNFERDWLDDARRYYSNIVGKYGSQVQAALKKLSALDIQTICPLHGPIWRTDLAYILDKYNHWSTYEPEDKSVVLIYGSMYGDTENAVNVLAAQLAEAGVKNIRVYDASSTHVSVLISEIFRSSHLVLASPTYNAGIYPAMLNLLHDMAALNIQNRTVGLIENGTWAPSAGKSMRTLLEGMKNMTILEPVATVKSALKKDSRDSLSQLKDALVASLNS